MACSVCGRAHIPERCKDGQIEYLSGPYPCPLRDAAEPAADLWTIEPEPTAEGLEDLF